MSRGSSAPYVIVIVNAAVVGVAAMFIGFWLMDIQGKQDRLQAQVDANAANVKKIAEAYNQAMAWRKELSDAEKDLRRETKEIESRIERKILSYDDMQSLISEAFDSAKLEYNDVIDQRVDQRIADSKPLVNTTASPIIPPQSKDIEETKQDEPEMPRGAREIIDASVAYDSIAGLAMRPFLSLYMIPPTKGSQQAILVTDKDEVFFLDRRAEIIESAWGENRSKAQSLIVNHLRSYARNNKTEFDAAILESVSEHVIRRLKSKSISSDQELLVSYGNSPIVTAQNIAFEVGLKIGGVSERTSARMKYQDIPGLIEIQAPRSGSFGSSVFAN